MNNTTDQADRLLRVDAIVLDSVWLKRPEAVALLGADFSVALSCNVLNHHTKRPGKGHSFAYVCAIDGHSPFRPTACPLAIAGAGPLVWLKSFLSALDGHDRPPAGRLLPREITLCPPRR